MAWFRLFLFVSLTAGGPVLAEEHNHSHGIDEARLKAVNIPSPEQIQAYVQGGASEKGKPAHTDEAGGTSDVGSVTYVGRTPVVTDFSNSGKGGEGITYVHRSPATSSFANGGKGGEESGTTYVGRSPETSSFSNSGREQSRGVVRIGR